jgi:hypothetical protein
VSRARGRLARVFCAAVVHPTFAARASSDTDAFVVERYFDERDGLEMTFYDRVASTSAASSVRAPVSRYVDA